MISLFNSIVTVFVLLSCQAEGNLQEEVLKGVLRESLLVYDLYDSNLSKGIIAVNDTSILLSEGDKESISRHLEEIIDGDGIKDILIDRLLDQQSKNTVLELNLPNLKLQSKVEPTDNVIGRVYFSNVITIKDKPSLVLFFYRFRCGNNCGSGNIVFARLRKGKWELESVYPLYVI
ncbi:hypothetical protein ACFSKL_06970 [Belliella marina]|uniref:Uncharacterized protein n=1 Tax=Belliella marina TaxID=1644146 RepID=A0ABW4VJM2_9BACT